MRSFNPAFTAEKNKRDQGPAPRNIVEFGFATPVKLSDSDVTLPGWDGVNLVPNGNMELDSGWADFGSHVDGNTRSNVQAHGGTYSRKLEVGHDFSGIKSDTFTTVTGTTYRFTCKVWRTTNVSPILVTIRNGAGTANIVEDNSTVPALGSWTTITIEFTETTGGSGSYILIEAGNGTTTHIDDVIVEAGVPIWSGINLLANGDMELTSGWSAVYSPDVHARSSEQAHGGTYSWKIVESSQAQAGTQQGNLTTTIGTLRFSFWYYVISGPSASLKIKVRGGDFTLLVDQTFTPEGYDGWYYKEFVFYDAVGGSSANVWLTMAGSAFTVYFDDAVLEDQSDSSWSGTNLVTNGDMELDANWADNGAHVSSNTRDNSPVYEGSYSRELVVSSLAAGIGGIANTGDRFTTVTGKKYRHICWVYRPAGASDIKITIRNGAGTADIVSESTAPTVGGWKQISLEYTETAGGSQAYVAISADQDTITYIDDVVVETEFYALQYSGLLKSWGFVDSSAGQVPGRSIVGQIETPDLALTIINSQSPRFSDHSTAADPIEGVVVTLYQWFVGTDLSEKEPIFVGVVRGQPKYDEREYPLTIKGIWHKYNRMIGSALLITEADYPGCDPDDVGKMQNIVYGPVTGIPCRAISAGAVDNLASNINSTQTTIPLVDATKFPTSGTGGIGIETFTWTNKSGNTLTGCSARTAGYSAGAVVFEDTSYYYYQLASHPVKAIDDVYVDGFLINVVATTYTGQSGDELAGYSGQAIVRLPTSITRANAEDLLEANGLSAADAVSAVASIEGTGNITISDTIALFNAVDVDQGYHSHAGGNVDTIVWKFDYGVSTGASSVSDTVLQGTIDGDFNPSWLYSSSNEQAEFYKATYQDYEGTPYRYRICVALGDVPTTGKMTLSMNGGGGSITVDSGDSNTTKRGVWTSVPAALDTWAEWNAQYGLINMDVSGNMFVKDFWIEIEVTPPAPSSAATGVVLVKPTGVTMGVDKTTLGVRGGKVTRTGVTNLTSNSVAEVEVGAVVTVDCDGHLDDGSGTITGTPNALLERPDHVYEHLLTEYCAFPTADVGASFVTSGTFYATNNYKFSLLLNQQVMADALLVKLGVQCRSRFFVSPAGVAQLILRQLGQASGHAIPKAEIKQGSMSMRRSAEDDLVNTFNILWDRDWLLTGPDAYRGAAPPFTDATSVGRYGTREPTNPALFYFDAVTDSDMVDHVGAYWLSFLKDSRKLPSFSVFLDNMEIEPGDIIDLTHPLDNMDGFVCEVLKIRHVPGSAKRDILDRLEILAVEN